MKSKGFTLIELMIVIAIMAILLSVTIPKFLSLRSEKKNTQIEITLDKQPKPATMDTDDQYGNIDKY